jgi:hypothetical protein
MEDAATRQPAWSRPADRAVVEFLAEHGPEYPAIVANRTGQHAPRVESGVPCSRTAASSKPSPARSSTAPPTPATAPPKPDACRSERP